MNLFETAAYAAEAGAAPGPGYMDLLLLVGFVGIFYFLLWRPQSKRRKEHQALMTGLAKGDEVVTAGGIVGKVSKLDEGYATVTVAPNVDITVQRSAISLILPKGTVKSL